MKAAMTSAEKNRHYRALRLAKGQCWFCTNPRAENSKHTCAVHLEYQRRWRRETPGLSTWKPGLRGRRPIWAGPLEHSGPSDGSGGGMTRQKNLPVRTRKTPCLLAAEPLSV